MKTRIPFILITIALLSFSSAVFGGDAYTGERDEYADRFLANYAAAFYNTASNGFPSDEANAVLQTRDGYMWFGGYSGLTRYDGRKYTVWNAMSQNSFNSSSVRALYEDGNGTLWIGTNDKGLVGYKNGTFTAYDKAKGAPSNSIRGICEGPGGIYCGTPDGLFRVDAGGNVTTVALGAAIKPFVISLSCDAQDNVYTVFYNGELFVHTGDGRTVQYPAESRILTVECVSGNRVIAGTQGGDILITRFNGEAFAPPSIRHTPLSNISAVYEDSRGYIWIASETGIGFLDESENYHNIGSLGGVGSFTGICEDYQNGYWITSSKSGVVKLTASAFFDLDALYHLETGTVNAILMDNGYTYIGTNNGLFILDQDGKPVMTDFTGAIEARVRGIFRDSRGNIWICTYSDLGVIRYSPETNGYKNFLRSDGLISERTRCMTELPNGVAVIGAEGGVSFIKGDDVITANEAFGTDKAIELPDITVLSLACSAGGTLYIGTDGSGIYAVDKDGTTRYQEKDGLTSGVILRMSPNPKTNGIWVCPSSGLFYIGENKKMRFIDKVPHYSFFDVMQYHDDLVLLSSSAIIRTDADSLLDPGVPFEHSTVDKTSGLTNSINANAWNLITDDGRLYFCDNSGVSVYDFESGTAQRVPYAGVAKIDVDGAEYTDFTRSITIPRDANRLTIELSYLSFGFSDSSALHYILAGQDDRERSLSKTDTLDLSYTNLKGGDYTLQVWTEDAAGNKGNFIEISLHKELKLLEHAYVWAIIAVLALLLVTMLNVAIVRYKSRRLVEKQREYRTIISQALSAIANTIDAKDSYTSGHSVRVAAYSVEIARRIGMDKGFIENLYYIGLLHDVGKIGIPNEIINKPTKLTDEEYDIMKQHTYIGHGILKDITTINNLTAGAAEHHEHWNGKGYYQGISGADISLEGRIIALADTYDAMSSDRSYRKGLPKDIILAEFERCKGSQFDPEILDVAIDMIKQDHLGSADVGKIIGISDGTVR